MDIYVRPKEKMPVFRLTLLQKIGEIIRQNFNKSKNLLNSTCPKIALKT